MVWRRIKVRCSRRVHSTYMRLVYTSNLLYYHDDWTVYDSKNALLVFTNNATIDSKRRVKIIIFYECQTNSTLFQVIYILFNMSTDK